MDRAKRRWWLTLLRFLNGNNVGSLCSWVVGLAVVFSAKVEVVSVFFGVRCIMG